MSPPRHTHHDGHVAHALKGEVHASVRHLHQDLLDGLAVVLRVHHVRGTKVTGHLELVRVEVHTDDPGGAGRSAAHNGREAQSAESKHGTGGAGFHLHSKKGAVVLD